MRICVVGCERSGTSAISSLLSIGSGWSLLDDPPESWYLYPLIFIKGYGLPLQFWWKLQRHDIVKVPGFATILPYLRRRFLGNFTALYCVRDPRDVAASIFERLEHGYSPLFTDVTWLGLRATSASEAIAWRWRRYLERALSYQEQGGRIIFIRYEDFYTDRMVIIVSIAEELRVPFDSRKIYPHLQTQFRKGWDRKIAGPGRWKRDLPKDDALKIVQVCRNLMENWEYEC